MAWLWPLTLQFLTKPRWSGGINCKRIKREEGRGVPSPIRVAKWAQWAWQTKSTARKKALTLDRRSEMMTLHSTQFYLL